MSDLDKRLREIVTRCDYPGNESDGYSSTCDKFGFSRKVKWQGVRNLDEWRLCHEHQQQLMIDFADEILRIS